MSPSRRQAPVSAPTAMPASVVAGAIRIARRSRGEAWKVTRMGIAGATPNPAMRLRAALEAASAHQSAIVHTAGNDMASVPTGGVAEIRYL